MKKTLLKRFTPLKSKAELKRVGFKATAKAIRLKTYKPLKRTAMKIKPKRFPIPKEELAKVDKRAGDKCEFHDYNSLCMGKLVYAHIKHRKMGGVQIKTAHIINDSRNITKVCKVVHDFIDSRIITFPHSNVFNREEVIEILKQKIGWHGWFEENKHVINR